MTTATGQLLPNDNDGPLILGVTLPLIIIVLVTTTMRLYVRIKMIKNPGWDDVMMTSGVFLYVLCEGIIIAQVHYGAGRHKQYVNPADYATGYKLSFVTQALYVVTLCLIKLSVGVFLLRIAVLPIYRRFIIVTMAFMSICSAGIMIALLLQCTNLAVLWDANANGTCWSRTVLKALTYTGATLTILTDVLSSIIIPVPLLWGLQMNRRLKLSLVCIFSLGIFATVACCISTVYLFTYKNHSDWLWDSRKITIWTMVEAGVGTISGNLPCLKPLFRSVLDSNYGTRPCKQSTPRYGIRSYIAGAGRHTVNAKVWNALVNDKTADTEQTPSGSYRAKESHLLTTVSAHGHLGNATRPPSTSVEEEEAGIGKSSVECVKRSPTQGAQGGIKVDTEVNVV